MNNREFGDYNRFYEQLLGSAAFQECQQKAEATPQTVIAYCDFSVALALLICGRGSVLAFQAAANRLLQRIDLSGDAIAEVRAIALAHKIPFSITASHPQAESSQP